MRERRGVARADVPGGFPDPAAPVQIGFPIAPTSSCRVRSRFRCRHGAGRDDARHAPAAMGHRLDPRLPGAAAQRSARPFAGERTRGARSPRQCAGAPEVRAAAMATVTALAMRLPVHTRQLDFWAWQGPLRLKVISHSAQFGQQMNLVSSLGAAMDEAIDQSRMIMFPLRPTRRSAPPPTRSSSKFQRDGQILTVPMLVADRFVGAMTFERPATCRSSRRPSSYRRSPRWWGRCWRRSGRTTGGSSSRSPSRQATKRSACWGRAIWAASSPRWRVAGAVLFSALRPDTYRIDAAARIEGLVRRAVVAPYRRLPRRSDGAGR